MARPIGATPGFGVAPAALSGSPDRRAGPGELRRPPGARCRARGGSAHSNRPPRRRLPPKPPILGLPQRGQGAPLSKLWGATISTGGLKFQFTPLRSCVRAVLALPRRSAPLLKFLRMNYTPTQRPPGGGRCPARNEIGKMQLHPNRVWYIELRSANETRAINGGKGSDFPQKRRPLMNMHIGGNTTQTSGNPRNRTKFPTAGKHAQNPFLRRNPTRLPKNAPNPKRSHADGLTTPSSK